MSLVNISIVGNLVKAPEQFCFKSGKVKTTLVVAVDGPNRKQEGANDTEFYRIEAWGKLGEIAHKYLSKGNQVGATGRLVMNRWQDREGKERVTPTVEANQISLPQRSKSEDTKTINPIAGELQFDKDDYAFITSPGQQNSPPAEGSAPQIEPSATAAPSGDAEEEENDSDWVQSDTEESGPRKRG
jgi:single-strand DNA-binding protein